MSSIKVPVQDLLAKLATITFKNNEGIVAPVYARLWNNQIENELRDSGNTQFSFPKPALFLEVQSPVNWNQIGQGLRQGDLGIRIHVVHEFYNALDGTMDQDLDVFDLRDAVDVALHMYKPTACATMTAIAESMDYDHGNIVHWLMDFVAAFIESKGSTEDPQSGAYVNSVPPTALQLTVMKTNSVEQAGTFPVNDPDRIQIVEKHYIIPQS